MDYFPHLELGNIALMISLITFGVLCCCFIVMCVLLRNNKHGLIIAGIGLILIIPSCIVSDMTVGPFIFNKVHFHQNEHFPGNAKCIEYYGNSVNLYAQYEISSENLKRWVEKYKLQEGPVNEYKSKMRENGQGLRAEYVPSTGILKIHYSSR